MYFVISMNNPFIRKCLWQRKCRNWYLLSFPDDQGGSEVPEQQEDERNEDGGQELEIKWFWKMFAH